MRFITAFQQNAGTELKCADGAGTGNAERKHFSWKLPGSLKANIPNLENLTEIARGIHLFPNPST